MKLERNRHETAVLDVNEAGYLALSQEGLYRLIRARETPPTRVGEDIRFRRVDLDAYLATRTTWDWKPSGRGRPAKKVADT